MKKKKKREKVRIEFAPRWISRPRFDRVIDDSVRSPRTGSRLDDDETFQRNLGISREHLIDLPRMIPWREGSRGSHASRHIAYTSFGQRWRAPPRHAARPRTRDNPCKRPSVYGRAVGRNNRRSHCPPLRTMRAAHRTPAGYHYCVDNRASFLLSGITTPRPISRPAARPVIAQFFQFTGPSSRVNTENSAGLTDLQGQPRTIQRFF